MIFMSYEWPITFYRIMLYFGICNIIAVYVYWLILSFRKIGSGNNGERITKTKQ